ncbi:MAG: uracil-DNA glycosylase [Pseudomonadota bacterium]|jgi:uracil-DNA glycosylase
MSSAAKDHSQVTWKDILREERAKPYFQDLLSFIEGERAKGKVIYPRNSEVFNALASTPFELVKVVIIGQDPYHGPNQAHGLSFSVQQPVPPPPSLINIFAELERDFQLWAAYPKKRPPHGCLESWAKQGVLLLNAVLTVEGGKPGSHANKGWERFTDYVIQQLNQRRRGLVFLLWGNYAQKKAAFVDRSRHLVLEAPHPSPLSAHRGFIGCGHFSKANQYLISHGEAPIEWGQL